MARMYGNLINRLAENAPSAPIQVGTDITMYQWSDRDCYYVSRVVNEKDIYVREYSVCADQSKDPCMGHQDWMYFKTDKECVDYLKSFDPDTKRIVCERPEEHWVFRYNKWMRCYTIRDEAACCTERECKAFAKNGFFNRYYDLYGKVRFGVRDYYYDWEF